MGNSKSNVLGFTSHTEFKRPENDFYSTDPREVEKLLEKESVKVREIRDVFG